MSSDGIKPFQIAIAETQLSDLRDRLSKTRFPDELADSEWQSGAPLADVQRLANYWAESFDWRQAEAQLNKYPQFTTDLQAEGFETMSVHFIHQRSSAKDAIPLLFIHGWPGSFYEGIKLIEPLTQGGGAGGANGEGGPKFHIVVPSIPNFGFSQGTRNRGFSIEHHAEILNKLMLRLGYDRYATQGGDWGWFISRALSLRYPAHARAQVRAPTLPTYVMRPFSLPENTYDSANPKANVNMITAPKPRPRRETHVDQAPAPSITARADAVHGAREAGARAHGLVR